MPGSPDRHIEELTTEVNAWETRRNALGIGVTWLFTTDAARCTLKRLYPEAP